MLRLLHQNQLNITNETTNQVDSISPTIIEALGQLRMGYGKPGRLLAKSLKKLDQGKLKQASHKIGIMGAILQLPDPKLKQTLLGHWADLVKGKLI